MPRCTLCRTAAAAATGWRQATCCGSYSVTSCKARRWAPWWRRLSPRSPTRTATRTSTRCLSFDSRLPFSCASRLALLRLASQPNPHDKDIDQVPTFVFLVMDSRMTVQPNQHGNKGVTRCSVDVQLKHQRQRSLRQHLQRLRQHLPCGDSGWPKGPSTGETRRQLPAANWLTLDDPPHGSLLRLRPRAGEPHQAVAVADSAQQHRLRAGAAAPGAHQAVSAGGLGAGPALRGPAGGAAAAGHQSGAPQGRLQVPEVPAPPQSHFAEWKNSARRWTSTTWPSWTSCSSSSPAWRTPRWGMFVGFGLFVCLLAFVTLSQPFDPSGSCSMALPASKNTWCLPMSGWLRLFSGGARVGWSFHLCPMPRQQCCQLQCR